MFRVFELDALKAESKPVKTERKRLWVSGWISTFGKFWTIPAIEVLNQGLELLNYNPNPLQQVWSFR